MNETKIYMNDTLVSNKGDSFKVLKVDNSDISLLKISNGCVFNMKLSDLKTTFNIKNPIMGYY